MSISLKTHKMLWGRAANRCAFPACRRELVTESTLTDDESLIGEAAHIIAKELGGPRGESPLTGEQRDKYENLVLLCRIHHKIIDDQINAYTSNVLRDLKSDHEGWVRSSLTEFDESKQRDEELYASYIEEWCRRADLEGWLAWSTYLLGPDQFLTKVRDEEIMEFRTWLYSRIWPKRYPELEASIENFRRVLDDFHRTFTRHAVERGGDLKTEKFHKSQGWLHPSEFRKLAGEWELHVYLLQDLILELTRAANFVCDKVRQFIDRGFRLREGIIMVKSGLHSDFSYHFHRPEYRDKERLLYPYEGLPHFRKTRFTRDECFGDIESESDS